VTRAASPRTRPQRSDGEQSRERLIHAALPLFAHQGFAKTSTRSIAEAAGTNLAAIKYYFGDKAGLYRAVFFDLPSAPHEEIAGFGGAERSRRIEAPVQLRRAGDSFSGLLCTTSQGRSEGLSLDDALRGLYLGFLGPLKQGALTRLRMKLQMREMLEPTGLWEEQINRGIKPMHDALVQVLCRHLGLKRPDDEVRRLAVCLAALGVHLHVGRDITDVLAPSLNRGTRSLDRWLARLVMYAQAMVGAEMQRRKMAAPH
jgi:AcrR family transcriptional regulator